MRITADVALGERTAALVAHGLSDVGSIRRVNEDSFVIEPPLFLVADGMGGHERGDVASSTVAAVLRERLGGIEPPAPEQVLTAIRDANDAVRAMSDGDDARFLSGTTLVGVALVAAGTTHHWMAFNVGDSRIYSWDGRTLRQLSVDHSVVQELVDSGAITAEAAAIHPDRNVITRAIGADAEVDVDVWLLPIGGRQRFLICSDGLTKELSDEDIAVVLADAAAQGATGADAVEILLATAIARGGRDNVTVVTLESVVDDSDVDEHTTATRPPRMSDWLEDTRPRA